jgi:hypothetical protein
MLRRLLALKRGVVNVGSDYRVRLARDGLVFVFRVTRSGSFFAPVSRFHSWTWRVVGHRGRIPPGSDRASAPIRTALDEAMVIRSCEFPQYGRARSMLGIHGSSINRRAAESRRIQRLRRQRISGYLLLLIGALTSLRGQVMNPHKAHATTIPELKWALNLRFSNVLIIGAREADLATVRAAMADPVIMFADALTNDIAGTCVIPDGGRLMRDQQEALRRRLERGPSLRVVTLSPVSLYPFVESGQFDETLFYRLNTITIYFTPESTAAA